MERYHIGKEGFIWFLGVVEDRQDPEQTGRVRVRCFGWHTDDKELVPTDGLPWAHILQPPNMPASYTCREGDYVFGFFLDAEAAQHPVIVGVIPGKPGKKPDYNKGFSDPNKVYPKRVGEPTLSRLALKDKYPKNWVHESELGHTFEIDDNEEGRIKLSHTNGTYVEFDQEGNRISVVKKNNKVTISEDNTVTIGGDCKISVEGDCTFSVGGKFKVSASDIILNASGTMSAKGMSTSVSADSDVNIQGGTSLLAGSGGQTSISGSFTSVGGATLDLPAGMVQIQGGATASPSIFSGITDAISGAVGGITDAISGVLSEVTLNLGLDNIVNSIDGALQGVTDIVSDVKSSVSGVLDSVSKGLSPVTELLNKTDGLLAEVNGLYSEINNVIAPVEKIIGKELFPYTEFYENTVSELNSFSSKIERIYDPLNRINSSVLSLNQELTNRVWDKVSDNDFGRVVSALDGLNRTVHNLNEYHNLSAKTERQIPNIGGRLSEILPAEYGIFSSYDEAESYAYFDPREVFGEDF